MGKSIVLFGLLASACSTVSLDTVVERAPDMAVGRAGAASLSVQGRCLRRQVYGQPWWPAFKVFRQAEVPALAEQMRAALTARLHAELRASGIRVVPPATDVTHVQATFECTADVDARAGEFHNKEHCQKSCKRDACSWTSKERRLRVGVKLVAHKAGLPRGGSEVGGGRGSNTEQETRCSAAIESSDVHVGGGDYQTAESYLQGAVEDLVSRFAPLFRPHTEPYEAEFAKVDDSPSTESGLDAIGRTDADAALREFEAALAAESSPPAERQARLHYNVGLVLMLLDRIPLALPHLRKASELDPDELFSEGLAEAERRERDREKKLLE